MVIIKKWIMNENGIGNKNENKPFYQNCKRRHSMECLKNSNKCFICEEAGNLKKDYPKNKDQKAPMQLVHEMRQETT